MAKGRPFKTELDYFSLDVGIFDDPKLYPIQEKYGPLGEAVYLRVLCLVYRTGYYYEFDSLDTVAAVIARSIGNRWAREKKTIAQIILALAENNLLSPELMQRGVMTSAGIQRRYQKAVGRRKSNGRTEYWLVDEDGKLLPEEKTSGTVLISVPKNGENADNKSINDYNNSNNVRDNATKKRKGKKSIVKERRPDSRSPRRRAVKLSGRYIGQSVEVRCNKIKKMYNEVCVPLGLAEQERVSKTYVEYVKEGTVKRGYTLADYRAVFDEVGRSRFLRGDGKENWRATFGWLVNPVKMARVLAGEYRDYGAVKPETPPLASSFEVDDFFAASMARSAKTTAAEDDDDVLPWMKGD